MTVFSIYPDCVPPPPLSSHIVLAKQNVKTFQTGLWVADSLGFTVAKFLSLSPWYITVMVEFEWALKISYLPIYLSLTKVLTRLLTSIGNWCNRPLCLPRNSQAIEFWSRRSHSRCPRVHSRRCEAQTVKKLKKSLVSFPDWRLHVETIDGHGAISNPVPTKGV